ncbi:MAG: cell surface protein SprA [Bacteroidetes bacterium]|nr:cell surface protein SprA [Bacteroidota bacterium]
MKNKIINRLFLVFFVLVWAGSAQAKFLFQQTDTLQFDFEDQENFEYDSPAESPLFLESPSNIKDTVQYDPTTNEYIISKKVGEYDYRPSKRMTLEEYQEYQFEQAMRNYWRQRARGESLEAQSGLFPNLRLGGEAFDKIFGDNAINIVPMGSAELIFKINVNNNENPTISENLRKTTTFDFEEKIMMNVTGNIGDKIKLGVNYNTEATFDFENQTKLEYIGKEDEIIKRIEAGNVTLPLPGSLITGSQSLFGIKTELQFGKLTVSSVFSQQKGETKTIEVKGGAQTQQFEIKADEYDANRHFFLSQYFRDHYNEALEELPVIKSPVTVTKIEVWVTNKVNNNEENRNIIALLDLGEQGNNIYADDVVGPLSAEPYPDNNANNLYQNILGFSPDRNFNTIGNTIEANWGSLNYKAGQDFEKIGSARKLKENEYQLNEKLGYISLNTALNADEVLAVAYELDISGRRYQVGDFSTDGITVTEDKSPFLVAKLLKGTSQTPRIPTWDLMMKNVYAIGAYQVNRDDFILNVLYQDDKTGNALNYIPEGSINKQILIKVLNLDNLNSQLDALPDGRFDFINGVTVNASNGRIIFPMLEPFGSYLKKQFADSTIANKYVFQELYDTSLTYARLVAEKNKFKLKGEYKSASSSEIMLNAINIPQGSVKVMAGGRQLEENVHYTVDYNLGRVKIIDQGLLESGTPLQISLESQALYSIQTKTLLGTHLNYQFSDNFNIGATVMNLTERPLTQKVAIGEEPISNTIWGLNTSYRTESQFITSMVDKLPFIETKEKSSVLIDAEFAHLIPGHSKAIEEEGNAYIDDFEGSETSMDMKTQTSWVLASTPQGQPYLFPETSSTNDSLAYGYNRAKIAWYRIDPLFLRNNSLTPNHIKNDAEQQSNHFVREIYEKEIFPNKESETTVPTALQVLNVAYYPNERGPYNYVTSGVEGIAEGLNTDGTLEAPETRWGGIMREIPTSDFEAANVEYIEFWLMDPFVYDSIRAGGNLYFNLGEISEDILKDSRKAFEDGLPNTEVIEDVDSTQWGRVPSNDYTTESFDNPFERQDVGFDGLSNEDEELFFQQYLEQVNTLVQEQAYTLISADPSNDDYHYSQGADYDALELSILQRYKKFNGQEGNSSAGSNNISTKRPDSEDINGDKTLNETESYFQYQVNLSPDRMEVGQNYIVDKVRGYNVDLPNGENDAEIYWYQFRIPIRQPDDIIGAIQDFKSIRFMRMFMKGFEDSLILRFAKLELVRSEWRKYELSLMEGHEGLSTPEQTNGSLEISSVNIEENDNYVLPPGVDRVIDPTNPQLRQLNEQSMVLKVKNLDDGDARAAYKTINLDIRQYEKLKMYVHAEEITGHRLEDEDLRVFIRLGTDYKGNYYEYEMPLKITPAGDYGDGDRDIVWPLENNIEIVLDDLVDVKKARNEELRNPNSIYTYNSIYSVYKDNKRISVRGNPNLSNVVTIMIGVRNPSKPSNTLSYDDGMPKYGEVWVNELRLTDFKEDGGWAARARVSTRLADLGTLNLAGSISTPGFGSIEKKVNERSKEEVIEYDVSTNLDLGKFFPEKAKVSIPVYAGYSESFINPEYNPLDPDILLKDALDEADSKAEKDSIKNLVQDYTQRKSINFTNVRINKSGEKPHFYDISNFSISYSYNETFARDINTEYDILKNYRGSFNYIFNKRPKIVAPFRRSRGLLSKKAFALIKDFNFYYQPTSISFRTDIFRKYQANKTRNIYEPNNIIEPTYNKDFNWNRYYDVKWDLTRSLKIDFSATNIARIDEPYGEVDKNSDSYDEWKQEVWNNIADFGRNTQYNHNINVTYRVPINKIPLLDWTNLSSRYNATYNWNAGPILQESSSFDLGNDIQNSNTFQLNGQANMVNLYNKVGFLKSINQKYGRGRSRKKEIEYEKVSYQDNDIWFREGRARSVYHDLNTEDITRVSVVGPDGNDIKGDWEVSTKRKIRFRSTEDVDGAKITVEGRIEKKENPFIWVAENTGLLLMSIKNISASYTITQGSSLAGYKESTNILGMNQNFSAPGWPFVLGWQDENFASNVIENGWYTQDTTLNTPFLMTKNESLNFRVTLEPVKGLKIDLTANRTQSENNNRYYYFDSTDPYSEQVTGNFSMTFITIGSAFEGASNENGYYSEAFEKFKAYRQDISQRLANEKSITDQHANDEGYMEGYGSLSQDVLGPAFLAAYGWYYDEGDIPLDMFQKIPLPNWSIRYDGLKDIPFMKKIFKSVNLSHVYRSSYNIGSFINNVDYSFGEDNSMVLDEAGNFIPEYAFNSVSINEQFSPLINVDLTWINNLTTRFEIKKSRTVTLSFSNSQITEVFTDELGFSLGYRFDDFDLIFNFGDGQGNFKSDLNIRANVKIRDNKTILRKIIEDDEIPSADQKATIIGVSADYLLSNRLTLRLFYDQNITDPLVGTNPYRISNTDVGFSLRFTLTE